MSGRHAASEGTRGCESGGHDALEETGDRFVYLRRRLLQSILYRLYRAHRQRQLVPLLGHASALSLFWTILRPS